MASQSNKRLNTMVAVAVAAKKLKYNNTNDINDSDDYSSDTSDGEIQENVHYKSIKMNNSSNKKISTSGQSVTEIVEEGVATTHLQNENTRLRKIIDNMKGNINNQENVTNLKNENKELKKRLKEVELQLDLGENEKYNLRKKVNESVWSKTKFLVSKDTWNNAMDFLARESNVPEDSRNRWKLMTEPLVRKAINCKRNTVTQQMKKYFLSKF